MDNSNPSPRSSRYQDYLPVILQGNLVLEGFLLAFEKVLTGYNDNTSLIIFDKIINDEPKKMIPAQVLNDEEFKNFLRKFMNQNSPEIFTQSTNIEDES